MCTPENSNFGGHLKNSVYYSLYTYSYLLLQLIYASAEVIAPHPILDREYTQ